MIHHTVAPGDTLSGIARKYGVTTTQVATANSWLVDINTVKIGWVLHIPAPTPGNYADMWWAANGGDPRTANLTAYQVTSPLNSGPGTQRDALSQSNRRITFSGPMVINLSDELVTKANTLHLVGQDGVVIRNRAVKFEGTNIAVQNFDFKDALGAAEEDCMTFRNASTTQVFAVQDCTFDRATDAGLDVIWNRGHDVYGLVERCTWRRIDKACLIDAGDAPNEGGRYNITFIDPVFEDCIQRMPMARNADIHIVRPKFIRYGGATGDGGGAKAAYGCKMLVENATIVPRVLGETMFNGQTVTKPRAEAIGPQLSTPTGAVRVVNCPPAPQSNERDAATVGEPGYR